MIPMTRPVQTGTPRPARAADAANREAACERLLAAQRTKTPCAPVRDLIGADDIEAAYAVQQRVAQVRRAAGARRIGHKIGLTSAAVQAQLGVDRPDFGLLFDDMLVPSGTPVDIDRLLQPKIEAEIAFVLAADLTGPVVDAVTARAAVAYASPALEIVDSRIAGWDIMLADTVADNASSGLFTLGDAQVRLDDVDLVAAQMSMAIDGEHRSAGSGAACMGDPLIALVWLAGTALEMNDPLRAGDIVLSGALGPMAVVTGGSQVRAEISGLGRVEAVFTTGAGR